MVQYDDNEPDAVRYGIFTMQLRYLGVAFVA
jgi:hypothetical protein